MMLLLFLALVKGDAWMFHNRMDGTYCDLENSDEYGSTNNGWGNGRVFENACCPKNQVVLDPKETVNKEMAKVVGCCPCGYGQVDETSTECQYIGDVCDYDKTMCMVWYSDAVRNLGAWKSGMWVNNACCPWDNTMFGDNGPSHCRKGEKFEPRNLAESEVGMSKEDMIQECWDNCLSGLPADAPASWTSPICSRQCPQAEKSVGTTISGLAGWTKVCSAAERQSSKKACTQRYAGCTWKGSKCVVRDRIIWYSYLNGEDKEDLYDCQKGKVARGMGPVHRVSLEDCKKEFKATSETFVYFAGSQHCQAAWERYPTPIDNPDWELCTYKGSAEEEALAMVTEKPSLDNIVVYGFAVVGLVALLYGAGRHFTKGSHAYSSVDTTV